MANLDFSAMSKAEAIKYCYAHKEEYILDFNDEDEGIRQFECLIAILESNTIQPKDLPSYGMDFE